jgi:hypothetical protein
MPGRLPASQATPVYEQWPVLDEIIALIRSWQAPVLPTPTPFDFGAVVGYEPQSESQILSVVTISSLLGTS